MAFVHGPRLCHFVEILHGSAHGLLHQRVVLYELLQEWNDLHTLCALAFVKQLQLQQTTFA